MAKYRKKPVIVEASQWLPGAEITGVYRDNSDGSYVITVHGQQAFLRPGDWVITEPDGVHHYPCKPGYFHAIYERVE